MRLLCCLDGTNIEQISDAVSAMLRQNDLIIGALYVTDTGPHGEIERQRERFPGHPGLRPMRREQMQQADQAAAQDILDEGVHYLPGAEKFQRTGKPEREIVMCASAWQADLIVICPRSPQRSEPALGPRSVGHVARFVLDHAPCPVLLVRKKTPIERLP